MKKNILFITQAIDLDDTVLGVYNDWVRLLAEKERVKVITLRKGRNNLEIPIFSLGGEDRKRGWLRRLKYIIRFWGLIARERGNYDRVFVHMNFEYVLLGAWFWKLTNKKIYFWYNHPRGGLLTRLAISWSDKTLATSKYSLAARYKKTILMPVGVRVLEELPKKEKVKMNLLVLGRIAPIKKIEKIIEAMGSLIKRGVDFRLMIVGDSDKGEGGDKYKRKLERMVSEMRLGEQVIFHEGVSNDRAFDFYKENDYLVNMTPTGSMDKTIFEAMGTGCLPVAVNRSLEGTLPRELLVRDSLGETLFNIIEVEDSNKNRWREDLYDYVKNNHSLDILVEKLAKVL